MMSLRSQGSLKKQPPEPLRRAVVDSLSGPGISLYSGTSHALTTLMEIGRSWPCEWCIKAKVVGALMTLTDITYLVNSLASLATMDLAYNVILEHTLAEKERSPAVVARCVLILRRYLPRYKPSEDTLHQIDRFCVNLIAECEVSPRRRSHLSSQQSVASTSTNTIPVSSFASPALVKSLNYVRSIVNQHLPMRSFQSAAFAGVPSTSRQSLPTLSSMLTKSFNSQLSPANPKDSETKDASTSAVLSPPIAEEVKGIDDLDFIALDVLKWRWGRDEQSSLLTTESDSVPHLQDPSPHSFLEVGAAALLVGDMEAKMKGQPWNFFGTAEMPYLDQLLQPSLLTTVTSSASARAHLRAITSSKRTKPGPNQTWEDSPENTFRSRARPLFQYRHYSDQQPLRLNQAEVCEVIAEVCSETPSYFNTMSSSSQLNNNLGKPSGNVAMSVLIKLVIDMYIMDPETASSLTFYMLEEMLSSPRLESKSRAFDLILNLGVHGHLLEPLKLDAPSTSKSDFSPESYIDNDARLATAGKGKSDCPQRNRSSLAISNFETWILAILYEILLRLVQIQEKEESVWASALSCLLYFICDKGNIRRNRLTGLDIRVVKVLIEVSRRNSWAELVRSKLICMLTNMFYEASDTSDHGSPKFLVQQVDLIDGIEFIYLELVLSNSREERRNLYVVLFDFVLHLINETCIATGVSEYSDADIQPIATLLMVADAPEAFYISVKLGVEGIGQLLKRSVADALATYPNSERLNMLLEKITEKLDAFISSFTHLDKEFTQMIQITKSYNTKKIIADSAMGLNASKKVKHSWATLHSLLHSERFICRQHGYVLLGDLLIAEVSDERDSSIWSNIRNLQQKIVLAGVNDFIEELDVPFPIWLMCGLLRSRNTIIRWGFLFVLERLLMRCKFLLDENELQHTGSSDGAGHIQDNARPEKANAVIDIMCGALSLVVQINETDRINILKMCDILFSQLCLKVLPASDMEYQDTMADSKVFSPTAEDNKRETRESYLQKENLSWENSMDDMKSRFGHKDDSPICQTASMASLLLHGQAVVPMRLVARVPAALFYWPLIQLAGEATDNIALGVSVGSKGPGAASDIRATLLLLLIGKCTADPAAIQEVGGEEFFRRLLDDTDSRVAYYSSTFLLKRMMTDEPESYQRMLQSLIFRAQQSNNEKLLENPYLQMRGILQLLNE